MKVVLQDEHKEDLRLTVVILAVIFSLVTFTVHCRLFLRLGASGILLHLQTKAASNVSDPLPAVTLDLSDRPTAETEAASEPAEGRALLAGRRGGGRVQRGSGEGPGPG